VTDHRRVKELFVRARQVAGEEREAWLARQCGNDEAVRREVEALLAAEEEMPSGYLEARLRDGLAEGSTVGRYRVIERLGAGGMGEVYRAHDEPLDRDVALKVLPELAAGDEGARASLLAEARAAAALNHPHVCTVHEVGEADGRVFIAMELLVGETLDRVIPPQGLPVERVVRYGTQIADALAHAHGRGVVHRDLKPGNVFVTPRGRVKVLDFGLAKRLAPDEATVATLTAPTLTRPGSRAGTPPYMAPELLRGEPIEARSDLWALGVVLYEMACGERPFKGRTVHELSAAILVEAPRPLPERVPEALGAVIGRCLEKAPRDRYQSADEVLADLEGFAAGAAPLTPAKPPPPVRPARRPAAALAVALAALALLIATILWLDAARVGDRSSGSASSGSRSSNSPSSGLRGRTADPIAVLPFSSLSPGARDELLELGLADTLIARLSGSSSLSVRSLASARRFAAPGRDPLEAGRQLGAIYVVEGSTQRDGERVRVNAKLLDVRAGTTMWAGTFDETMERVFTLQDGIAAAVIEALELEAAALSPAFRSPCEGDDTEAYRAFLAGRYQIGRLDIERLRSALAAYRQAIDRDPSCARAYAGIAWAYRAQPAIADVEPGEPFRLARAAAEQAIAIDPQLGSGFAQRAWVELWYDWDWTAAEASFRRALELDPSAAEAHLGYAHLLAFLGRFEAAVGHADQAGDLDALSPLVNSVSAGLLGAAGWHDAGRRRIERVLELDPGFWHGLWVRGGMMLDAGDSPSAIADLERAAAGAGKSLVLITLAEALARAGNVDRARAIREEVRSRDAAGYLPATSLAAMELVLGDRTAALDLLERAHREHDIRLVWLSVDARWNPLRAEPRFRELAERMGLPNERATGRF
jgi:serine/threonine-protein kinase